MAEATATAEPVTEHRSRPRRIGAAIGNQLLTLAAIGGVVCIAAVIAALLFNISLIMFSTGSMSPTIPAGSVAVVRQIPAAQVAVGDVVTVDRPGRLPVTHRVTSIDPAAGDTRLLTLRGDANASEDPERYTVTTVRRVMFSVPKLASVIVAFSNPFVLGGITIGAALLVTWAFWPRGANHRAAGGAAGGLAVVLLVGGAMFGQVPPARAGLPVGGGIQVIRGDVIVLTSIGDRKAMKDLRPGVPVHWQVGVAADAPDPGRIQLSLSVDGALAATAAGLQLSVGVCGQRWDGDACATGGSQVVSAGPAARYRDTAGSLGSMPSAAQRWLQVTAWLPPAAGPTLDGSATVLVRATGFGDSVDAGPGVAGPDGLSRTGFDLTGPLFAALAAICGGLGLAWVARERRRRTDGEPA